MNFDILKGRKCMVWTFMGNPRMYAALKNYGDRLSQVGLFSFKVDENGTITEQGVAISDMLPYIHQWPHITWLLTVRNDGISSVFKALREDTNGAQNKFLTELIRIMKKYPWCSGVDIDLERGGDYSTHAKSTTMFRNIYNAVKSYDSTKKVNICLPGMDSVNGSVGGENWCVYKDLNPYCNTAAIMSYGMAWAGSAPGPVSPRDWLVGIYDYASRAMTPEKIFMGLPAYGWNWQIYDTPENLGETYRGDSNTYYAAKNWITGKYNFTDDKPPQPFIPILAYWDDYNKVPYAFPQVYDFMEGKDAANYEYPLMDGTYNRHHYLTAYGKKQKRSFGTIYVDHDGKPDTQSGIVSVDDGLAIMGDKGKATYNFKINTTGTYDIAVRLCYPFWDKNGIYISIDGTQKHFKESRLWWPYWRDTFWTSLAKDISLSAGIHTITVSVDVKGVQFYGFRVCSNFSESPSAGTASFTLSPRHFINVDGKKCQPDRGFKLTCEMLRRNPDSALIWYEDFQDNGILDAGYWKIMSGSWKIWRSDEYSSSRVYSQLEGSGRFALNYSGFRDIHFRAQFAFPYGSTGKAGIFCGSLFCCLNYNSQALELWNGNTKLGSCNQNISQTSYANLRSNPNSYSIEMRIRGNTIRVYSGPTHTLQFTATVNKFSGGAAGYQSDQRTICDLLRVGDAWTYEPYERFDVTFPDGSTKQYGRINRSNCTWNSEFQVFTLTSDIEESETRTESISMDYEFYHSGLLNLNCENDYTITINPKDINIWISRLFLGDADGFSILYYQDVDSLVYWSNQAAYRWGLRGFALWSLGQEDLRLWEALPKQTDNSS